MSAEAKLVELKLELPPAPKPMGVYKPLVIVGNLAYVSGHGPLKSDGSLFTGRVGDQVDQQYGYQAARQTGLAILATEFPWAKKWMTRLRVWLAGNRSARPQTNPFNREKL